MHGDWRRCSSSDKNVGGRSVWRRARLNASIVLRAFRTATFVPTSPLPGIRGPSILEIPIVRRLPGTLAAPWRRRRIVVGQERALIRRASVA
jgi:hypothetical protein